MEHTRGFGNSNLTDSHEHDEERTHQDLGRPDVTDSGKARDRAHTKERNCDAPLMLTFSMR